MPRCSLCPALNPVVPADGPLNAKVMCIGESPGKDETRMLRPFVGKTGEEVNSHYLPLAGLRRQDVFFCNAFSCQPSTPDGKLHTDKVAHKELMESCANCHLYPLIEKVNPDVIITMGAFAALAIDPTINLELHHGIPRDTQWGKVVPFYHPALGLYEPKKMLMIRTDWDRLRRYLRETLVTPTDEYAGFEDYQHLKTPAEVKDSLDGEWDKPLGADTEITYRRQPYCVSYSTRPGTGYVLRADDRDCLDAFQQQLDRWTGKILFHNWLFDSNVVDAMGLRFPEKRIVDTMERVYHLGNLPQGLKALALRELDMVMQDFEDLVRPHSTPLALEYFRDGMCEKWERPQEELKKDFKTGEWKIYKPQGIGTKFKRFLTDYRKNPDTKDPFAMWQDNWSDYHDQVEAVMGPFPGLSIEHVPWAEAIHYAARDADTLVRLWPLLKHMSKQVRKKPQEKWRDDWM